MSGVARRSIVLLALIAGDIGGCSALTSVDRTKAIEATAALCGDGIDNDGDGLTDCQDWKCLGQKFCCDVPKVVLDDTFAAAASCPCPSELSPSCDALADPACAPSSDKWNSWGTPAPRLCVAGFVSCKVQDCYDVGLLSKDSVVLEPGVKLAVTFAGTPETRGRLTAALTLQEEPPALSAEACLPITPIQPVAAMELVANDADPEGSVFVPQFGGVELPRITNARGSISHEVAISVDDHGRISFTADGQTVTTQPDQIVPGSSPVVHVAIYGRGLTSHVTHVRLSHGAKCEDPSAWQPPPPDAIPPPSPLSATPLVAWEGLAVFRPSVAGAVSVGTDPVLAYSGCPNAGFSACPYNQGGAGIARYAGGVFNTNAFDFVNDSGSYCNANLGDCSSSPTLPLPCSGDPTPDGGRYYDVAIGFLPDQLAMLSGISSPAHAFLALLSQPIVQRGIGGRAIWALVTPSTTSGAPFKWTWACLPYVANLQRGLAGSWESEEICCAALAHRENDQSGVWYSGRGSDGVWQIGQATLDARGFTKSSANPVLGPGPPGSYDQRGVSDPAVVWDDHRKLYRMWYVAWDSLQETSIALAVSTDGIKWRRFPGNPVVRASQVGLRTIANPAVLLGDDGIRMWVDGESATTPGVGIFEIRNSGVQPQ